MAHPEQFFFVENVKLQLSDYFRERSVLEVGSLNINGSVRVLFENCEYLGLDVGAGPGVDVVMPGQHHGARAGSFDVVISCEAMEHNPAWPETWLNMLRLMAPSGLMIMTCATAGRAEHGTAGTSPEDSPLTAGLGQNYYRNLVAEDFRRLAMPETWFAAHEFFTDHVSHDLYFVGIGRSAALDTVTRARGLITAFEDYYYRKNIFGLREAPA
jgi:SAM-dependent methyltransferase